MYLRECLFYFIQHCEMFKIVLGLVLQGIEIWGRVLHAGGCWGDSLGNNTSREVKDCEAGLSRGRSSLVVQLQLRLQFCGELWTWDQPSEMSPIQAWGQVFVPQGILLSNSISSGQTGLTRTATTELSKTPALDLCGHFLRVYMHNGTTGEHPETTEALGTTLSTFFNS